MLRFKLLSSCLLIATLSSCGSDTKTIKDNWLGVDEITLTDSNGVQTFAKAFNLKSRLALPKIGKGVSYKISMSCHREVPEGSKKQRTYTKSVSYKAEQNQFLEPLPIVDHLPEVTLIFPEFFKTCDISFLATNQHGSTAGSELLDQGFKFQEEQQGITATPFDLKPSLLKYPIQKKHLKNISIKPINKKTLKNSKLLCFSKELSVTDIQKETSKDISGALLKLPTSNLEVPVENCVIKAINNSGETVVSNRIRFLNGLDHESTDASITYSLNGDTKKQIPYSKSQGETYKLFSFALINYSDAKLDFKFKKSIGKDFINVITKLSKSNVETQSSLHKRYQMNLQQISTSFFWKREDREMLDDTFNLRPQETSVFSLYVKPNFNCVSDVNRDFNNSELGFIIAPEKRSELLELQQTSTNEFTTDIIIAGNLFKSYRIDGWMTSNLPKYSSKSLISRSEFQIFFRNQKRVSGKPLDLSYIEKPSPMINGEFPLNLKNLDYYQFSPYVDQKPDHCSSLD